MKNFFLCLSAFILVFFLSCSQPALDKNNSNEQTNDSLTKEIQTTEELNLALNQAHEVETADVSKCTEPPVGINPTEIVGEFYSHLLTGNVEGMLGLLADDLSWTHLGPLDPSLPFYNTFYGKDGFLQWLNALVTSANLNGFTPKYMISDGNRVDSSVLEGAFMLIPQTQVNIENFHTFKVNNNGKINYVLVISESDTVVKSLSGSTGDVFETEHKIEDYQSNFMCNEKIIKDIALLATYLIKEGKINLLNKFISGDIETATSGNESSVPFFGKFIGKKELKNFSRKLAKEVKTLNIKYAAADGNKSNVHCVVNGKSSNTNENYRSKFVFCFQFDNKLRIARLYVYCNTNIVAEAYR